MNKKGFTLVETLIALAIIAILSLIVVPNIIIVIDKNKEKAICVFTNKGVKNNPILWSKSLYQKAQIIPENAHMRVVLMEHSDYIKNVEIKDEKKFLDINYASQLKEYSES